VNDLLGHPQLLAECVGGTFLGLALIGVGILLRLR
jgi:hypothetical protein